MDMLWMNFHCALRRGGLRVTVSLQTRLILRRRGAGSKGRLVRRSQDERGVGSEPENPVRLWQPRELNEQCGSTRTTDDPCEAQANGSAQSPSLLQVRRRGRSAS